ncbi:MAG: hypothetical protein HC860_00740 [Alkalinema sp. RU_4_3]|nr:hypothetical protein [Alkalinema sp. RU_4_3]
MQASTATSELRIKVPEKIRLALEAYAVERNYSIEFVVEMALSQFLDADGVTFEDCDPVLNPGKLREQVEILQYQLTKK